MTTPATPRPLPLSFGGRSLLDGIRIRWGGLGCVVFGILLLFSQNAAGIIFGVMLAPLGIMTWAFSSLGGIYWWEIPSPKRNIVAVGAVLGFLMTAAFLLGSIAAAKFLQAVAKMI